MIIANSERTVRRTQATYVLVNSVAWFAAVLPMAVTVLYAQSRGFSVLDVGLYTSVYALTVAVLEIPTGALTDAMGRKRAALLSYLLSLAAAAALLFAFSLPVLIGFALLHGAARAFGSGALQAWFVDALQAADPAIDLQPPLARAGAFELLALAAATLVGGWLPTLASDLPNGGTAVLTPLATPILASAGMTLVTLALVALLVREPRRITRPDGQHGEPRSAPHSGPHGGPHSGPPSGRNRGRDREPHGRWNGVVTMLRDVLELTRGNPTVSLLLAVEMVGGFGLAGIETFWQPFFAERLGPLSERTWIFGVVLAGSFGVGMLGNLLAIPLTRALGGRYGLTAAVFQLLRVFALVALALQHGAALAAVLFWLVYFAMGGANSPFTTAFNLQVPAARRSVMLSVLSMASFVGAFLGSLLLGLVAANASIATAWVLTGVIGLSGVALLVAVDRHRDGRRNQGGPNPSPRSVPPAARSARPPVRSPVRPRARPRVRPEHDREHDPEHERKR